MKILITRNAGYIGSMLAKYLRKSRPHAKLVGYDSGFFAHCLSNAQYLPEFDYSEQHWGDLRSFSVELLAGVDAVVHLAAISNDPMGKRFERVTELINYEASRKIAEEAKARGVRTFVFASSCSLYGCAEGCPKTEVDELKPLTVYARIMIHMVAPPLVRGVVFSWRTVLLWSTASSPEPTNPV